MFLGVRKSTLNLILSGAYYLKNGTVTTVSQIIAGSNALNKFGSSSVTLSAINKFTGPLFIRAGTLIITGTLGSGTYAAIIVNNGILIFNSATNQTLSGILSGNGALTKSNAASTVTLSGINTFTGTVTINSGAIAATADTGTGTSKITINGGILRTTANGYTLGATKTITIGTSGGTIDNTTGTFNKAINLTTNGQLIGSGTLTLTGGTTQTDVLSIRAFQSLFSGNVNINSGRLEISTSDTGTGVNYLIGTGAITIASGGSLAFGADITAGAWANTIPNAITVGGGGDGTGAIHSKSTANTTFTNTVTLTAATTIANDAGGGGTIIFSNVVLGSFTLTCNVNVQFNAINTFTGLTLGSGRTLSGTGTIPTVSIPNVASSVLQPGTGSGTVGTLTISGNLTFAGSTSALSISSNGTTAATVSVSGTTALGACKVNLLNTMPAGTFTLITSTGTMSGTLPTIGTNSSGRTPTFSQVGNNLLVTLV